MCKDEKFSISEYGYEEDLENITAENLYQHYKEILRNYKSVCSRVYKLPTIFATSLLRFSLVHPTSVLLCNMGLVKSKRKAEDNG